MEIEKLRGQLMALIQDQEEDQEALTEAKQEAARATEQRREEKQHLIDLEAQVFCGSMDTPRVAPVPGWWR